MTQAFVRRRTLNQKLGSYWKVGAFYSSLHWVGLVIGLRPAMASGDCY
jgi:hypothetical protein